MYIQFMKKYKGLLLGFFAATILLSVMCSVGLKSLLPIAGFFVGWVSVFGYYVNLNPQKRFLGDVLLVVLLGTLIYTFALFSKLWCSIITTLPSCSERSVSVCIIGFVIPLSVAVISAWLWVKLRFDIPMK